MQLDACAEDEQRESQPPNMPSSWQPEQAPMRQQISVTADGPKRRPGPELIGALAVDA